MLREIQNFKNLIDVIINQNIEDINGDLSEIKNAISKLQSSLGLFHFYIDENGDLILEYGSPEAPNFQLNQEDGCLYYIWPD